MKNIRQEGRTSLPVSSAPIERQREYVYQASWRAIAINASFFFVCAVVIGFEAVREHAGLVIDGVISLTTEQATYYRWFLTACSLGLVLTAAFQGFRRLTAAPRRIVLTRTAVIIPKWRGEQSISYDAITKLNVLRVNGMTFVLIRHAGGKARIFRTRLPSKAAFDQVCAWLKARTSKPG